MKLVCKGPVTIESDTEKLTEPNLIGVELDQAAGWASLDGWLGEMLPAWPKNYTARLPITSSGDAVTFTNTVTGNGIVSVTTGRIELSTGRLHFTTKSTASKDSGEQWTSVTITGDVPCRAP